MFQTFINDATSAAASVLTKYALRASVAVPFLVAAGFATVALTIMLVERFGSRAAYGIMAGGFAVFGLIAALAVTVKEQDEEVAEAAAVQNDTAEVVTDAAAEAAVKLPLTLLGPLFVSQAGPATAIGSGRMIGRNLPLAVVLGLMALLLWPIEKPAAESAASDEAAPPPRPDAAAWEPANAMDQHAV